MLQTCLCGTGNTARWLCVEKAAWIYLANNSDWSRISLYMINCNIYRQMLNCDNKGTIYWTRTIVNEGKEKCTNDRLKCNELTSLIKINRTNVHN